MDCKKVSFVVAGAIVVGMIFMQLCVFHRKPITNRNVAMEKAKILQENLGI